MDIVLLFVLTQLPRSKCCFTAIHYHQLIFWLHSSSFEQICHNINCKEYRNAYTTLVKNLKRRNYFIHLASDGMILLK
jgi:hypothetical protein